MTQPRAVIHVVRAQGAAKQPHHEVVLFVRALGRGEAGESIRTAGRLDPEQLLGRQLERFLPGGLTERRVPVLRRRDAVADVQVQPLEQRQRAHALAGGARWRAGLGPLSFRFDRPPWSRAPFAAVGSFPDPAPNPLLPAPSYQRPSEAVAVLQEIVAEAALHAGGALVGGVQLDVGGRDADDLVVGNVQVHLTADAAIRADRAHDLVRVSDLLGGEPLARHHLEDRAGGTDANTFAAPRAPGLVGVG